MSRRAFLATAGGAAATYLSGCGAGPAVAAAGGNGIAPQSLGQIVHFLATGQSLAVGIDGAPAISTSQPFNNKMFTFPSIQDPDLLNDPLTYNAFTDGYPEVQFRPLLGGPSASGEFGTLETIANGFADSLTARAPSYEQLMSCSGVGGTAYSGLAGPSDAPPNGTAPFQEMMSQVMRGHALALAANLSYSVAAMLVIHGEADGLNTAYADNLATWRADTQAGANATTGQNEVIPMIASQTQAVPSGTGLYASPFLPTAGPLGTFAASLANPGLIHVACPEYMMEHHYYEDSAGNPDPTGSAIHMTADGYRHLGLMLAKAAYAVCVAQTTWTPLMPTSVSLNGRVLRIEYAVPVGPLVIDSTYVTDPGDYGFNYLDYAGTTITGVAVTGPSEISVTLSVISGGGYLAYGLVDAGPNVGQDFGPRAGPRGCVRDSDPMVSFYNNSVTGKPYPMQNYSLIWQASVVSGGGFSFT